MMHPNQERQYRNGRCGVNHKTRGQKVYNTTCAVCHRPDGSGMPPAFPAMKGGPIAVGPIDKHIDLVIKGVPGTAMQAFGGQLKDADIAAVVTYERNAFGNADKSKYGKDAGGIATPKHVDALRK